MNEILPLRRWAIGVALGLTLTHSPLGISTVYADSAPLQQALAQQLSSSVEAHRLPIAEFYQLRDGQPAWQSAVAVESLVAGLNSLAIDGLAPEDYHADTLLDEFQRSQAGDEAAQASFDVKATRSLLLALDHLERGKVNPRDVESQWDAPRPERGYSLLRVVHAVDDRELENAMALARPSSAEYQQLRATLKQHYQLANLGSVPYLDARDESLRPGDEADDVSVLRQRLALWGEAELQVADGSAYPMISVQAASNRRTFDAPLEAAVRRFQRRHLLQEDGVVGEQTRLALNTSVAARIDQLRVNLERARWIRPMQSAEPRVWVDIAGYRMHYVRPNGQHWDARVVVGSSRRETPIIHSTISHLTINPSWTIPPTIMREDVLPQVRADIDYLARKNIQVISLSGEQLVAEEIDWQRPGGVMLRQVAGSGNPLGRVVVRFPNDDMIYLHDTPARGLFQREQRALSSGCIRVEGVAELAQMLLQDTGSRYQMSTLLSGGSDRNVSLTQRIPIALHYLTAWPNAEGEVEFRPDIYRRDATLLAALRRPV
ncbi:MULTISPECIES: L,D-transpeptidase family protein [unclassified Halomonas]|uniref:L,D-transpeptidase family protein n=1 Tax=unclassified Halomonas TaxID=2609666 RepID=UPI00054E2D6D|nr:MULTISPECIES: L,D-transpeptidase family protein [unclassified Halomonas]CEP37280.1 Putative L,D-transpeptidase YcbB [Halomonas sp. R57-5]